MAPSIAQARIIASGILLGLLWLPLPAKAGIDDCLQVALGTANPSDLKKALAFATGHPTCLDNLVPPTLIPYIALSGSLDVANQSGALNQVGLGFGNSYPQCVENMDPGKHAVKQLAPVLKPVCSTLNMNCNAFEGAAADEVNAQLVSEVPLLGMMPCACAAATSGLGVERIAELLKAGQNAAPRWNSWPMPSARPGKRCTMPAATCWKARAVWSARSAVRSSAATRNCRRRCRLRISMCCISSRQPISC